MESSVTYEFCIPEARYLADLYGICADLHSTQETVRAFLTYSPINPVRDLWIKRSLCLAALISYGRICGEGVRQPLPIRVIESLGAAVLTEHRYFKNLRDKWAAHSVNNFEQSGVTLEATVKGGLVTPRKISDQHKNVAVLSSSDMSRLQVLAAQVYQAAQVEVRNEQARLLCLAKGMDLSVLVSQPHAFSAPVVEEHHARPRPKYGA